MKRKKKPTPEEACRMIGLRLERSLHSFTLETFRDAGFSDRDMFDARRLAAELKRGSLPVDSAGLARRLVPKFVAIKV